MSNILKVYLRLIIGFIFCAASTVFMLNSNLGLSPWDVFHEGLSRVVPLTIGEATIRAGVIFLLFALILGEKLGLGTMINIILVGYFIDFIIYLDVIPVSNNLFLGIIMMVLGLILMGVGCYLYMGCALGCGPRDAVMIGINKKIGYPIKYVRAIIELSVMVLGIFLGGKIGLGTLISAIGLGYTMQIIFKLFNFEPHKVKHESLMETLNLKRVDS